MRCPRCCLRTTVCLCSAVPTVLARTRVVVLRHAAERHRPSNSARWAALALPNSQVIEYGAPGEPFDDSLVRAPGTWLLYPGPMYGDTGTPPPRPDTLLVLDGSWSQTRRMAQRIAGLAALPRLVLPPAPPRRRLRKPPPGGLATLEAIARALETLEGAAIGAPLDALYDEAVRRSNP